MTNALRRLDAVVLAMLTACGTTSPEEYMPPRHYQSDVAELAKEIVAWKGETLHPELRVIAVKDKVSEANPFFVGVCTKHVLTMPSGETASYREIILRRDFWEHATVKERYYLLAHELGHCQWDLQHSDALDDVMYPWMIQELIAQDDSNLSNLKQEVLSWETY